MLVLLFNERGSGKAADAALCLVRCPGGCGEVSEEKRMLIHGDSEKNSQGLTLELTKCLPWSFRIMVRSF